MHYVIKRGKWELYPNTYLFVALRTEESCNQVLDQSFGSLVCVQQRKKVLICAQVTTSEKDVFNLNGWCYNFFCNSIELIFSFLFNKETESCPKVKRRHFRNYTNPG